MEQAPSVGKTVAIAASIPIALQDVLWTILHELYGFEWATPRFIASLVLLVSFAVAAIMHTEQRKKEDVKISKTNGEPVIGVGPGPTVQ